MLIVAGCSGSDDEPSEPDIRTTTGVIDDAVRVRVPDGTDGEIYLRCPLVMLGCWNRPGVPATVALRSEPLPRNATEVQQGVVGDSTVLRAPAHEVASVDVVSHYARLAASRSVGVPVIHCTAATRSDGLGANRNARLFAGFAKTPVALTPGSDAVAGVPRGLPTPCSTTPSACRRPSRRPPTS